MIMEQNISNWVTYLIRKKIHIIIVTSSVLLVCLVVKKTKRKCFEIQMVSFNESSNVTKKKRDWKGDVPN